MRRWFTLIALVSLVSSAAMGGDIAMFENLGFSDSADVFVFAQYGVTGAESRQFAEIYAIDVASNRFLPNGVFEATSDRPLELGQDGRGALYSLLRDATPLLEQKNVDPLSTGRPIYILVDGQEPKAKLTFRDFVSNTRYDVTLTQQKRGTDDAPQASFGISLTMTKADDSVRTLSIGRPTLFRDGVTSYRITEILVGPKDASVIFVVEKRLADGSVRYMVETSTL